MLYVNILALIIPIHHNNLMITLIDNYDSFTYNLVQYFGDLGVETNVIRNDHKTAQEVIESAPKALVLSPGPCTPSEAGICLELINLAANTDIPLLGVCLGHQAIGQAFGGNVIKAPTPVHGKTDNLSHMDKSVFRALPQGLTVTRYHSLIIERDTLPSELEVTAETRDGLIMGVAHKTKPIHGVQFHPESIATECGHDMLKNFINLI